MGRGDALLSRVDESLALRISRLSPGSQRWLKTMLYAIRTGEASEAPEGAGARRQETDVLPRAGRPAERPPSLEDVITGGADLREHLQSYPELADELEGLADIIDMLREAGEQRRKRGEKIFREEILGEPPEEEEGEEPT
jgi:hypothetical protein